MMNSSEFRQHAHEFVDWMADYLENIENLPVKSAAQPGDIFRQLPESPPETGEPMSRIMADFQQIILPGITHWQSPNFFAYFPANSSYPSLLAEMLTATLGAQCMIWDTSPAAAELEEKMMEWLKELLGLPKNFSGVIQDTASTATLTAILTAREKAGAFKTNHTGLRDAKWRVYCSTETHSSIEKAVTIAGIGRDNLVKVAVDEELRLAPKALSDAIGRDLRQGLRPLCAVATLGTTSTTAVDPLGPVAALCREHQMWLHVDAAFAGTALALPEFRWMIDGIETVDSFVMNPHKWMFTNFDCSAYFVRDREALLRTFEILPEYLKTTTRGAVNDYRDWGIQLGRRFRALKLWFVLRSFGIEGIRDTLRLHLKLANDLAGEIQRHPDFELTAPHLFNLLCFRYRPEAVDDEERLNALNETLLQTLNATGRVYMTHTRVRGKYSIRLCIGQTYVNAGHVRRAWELIVATSQTLVTT